MKELRIPWGFWKKDESVREDIKTDYTVISSVNDSLMRLLRQKTVPQVIASREEIGICSPGEHGDMALGIYLYDIEESGEMRLNGMQPLNEQYQQYPPMYLNLYYMFTAYSNIDIRYREEENHRILAKVMQLFHDYPILEKQMSDLSQEESGSQIHIVPHQIKLEEKMAIWHNQGSGYQLSIFYKIAPVKLNSTIRKEISRVKEIQLRPPHEGGGDGR